MLNLPGSPMVGVLPTNAKDTDSILVREDPTWHRATTEACAPYSLCSSTEPVLQGPGAAAAEACAPFSLCSTTREATAMRNPHTTARVAPACHSQKKDCTARKTQHSQNKQKILRSH